ncbi:MAG: RDD family protein [Candidatus Saccharibacteria bacterium]
MLDWQESCIKCGAQVGTPVATEAAAAAAPTEPIQPVYQSAFEPQAPNGSPVCCTYCGESILAGQPFCTKCGTRVGHQTEPASSIYPSPPPFNSTASPPPGFKAKGTVPADAYAGVGMRFLATLIDSIFGGILWFIIMFTGVMIAVINVETKYNREITDSETGTAILIATLIWFLIGLFYYIGFEALAGGTLGKLICGLRVLKKDGSDIGAREAALRTVARIIDGIFCYLVAAICVWTTDFHQRVGDMMADTVVVYIKKTNSNRATAY